MRAVGIVRVSQSAGREGESFVSPREQRQRIEEACERDGMELVALHEEIDVSGGMPLTRREGLRTAVEAIESGEAEILIAAYFDRLMRSLEVQGEVVSRVEAAGGRVRALDVGDVSGVTAGQWISGTALGMVSEYVRRAAKERSSSAQADAVARGVVPWPNLPPGLRRGVQGTLEVDEQATVAREAFRMRAAGETIKRIRSFLREHGIDRSYHGVQSIFRDRLYLGEVHFGKLVNLHAHEPLIDRATWDACQRVPRGRRPKSDRLLARLGVLRCGTCGARMVVGVQTQNGRRYPFYRCPPVGDCTRRVTISAEIAERVVTETVRELLADQEGRASAVADAQEADGRAERAQADLDSAIRTFAGLEDEAAARERLEELRSLRDSAVERAGHLRGLHSGLTIRVADDWERLTIEERRGLIRAVVDRASVGLGRGAERISVVLRGE